MPLRLLKGAVVTLFVILLAACGQTSVDVGDVPATQYRHVWITVGEIRLHADSRAKLSDAGWQSVSLPTPVSLDLLELGNGNLSRVLERQVAAGTYDQVRLFMVDPGATLTDSARSEGLSFNDQVEFTDSRGNVQVRALELVAPNDGVRIAGSVQTKRSTSFSTSTVSKVALLFDSRHDVIRFDYGGFPGFLLNPRVQAADLTNAGAISGQVDLSAVAPTDVLVQAETSSIDGTYHVVAGATPIASDGRFLLYPLPLPSGSTSATYDLVITGTGAATIIIKSIPVSVSSSSNTLNPTAVQSSALALTPATSFAVNVNNNDPLSPKAATVRFYQTVQGTSEVPYEIAARTANPFTGTFFDDVALAAGPVNVGTYNGGADITLTSMTPQEGTGAYQPVAEQAGYARRAANATLSQANAPAGGALTFTVPELAVESDATELTLAGTITTARPGTFDSGFLLLARDGRVITTMPLGDFLVQSGLTYAIGNVAGGSLRNEFTPGVYSLYARVWSSADPERTVTRISFPSAVDLSTGNPGSINLSLP